MDSQQKLLMLFIIWLLAVGKEYKTHPIRKTAHKQTSCRILSRCVATWAFHERYIYSFFSFFFRTTDLIEETFNSTRPYSCHSFLFLSSLYLVRIFLMSFVQMWSPIHVCVVFLSRLIASSSVRGIKNDETANASAVWLTSINDHICK